MRRAPDDRDNLGRDIRQHHRAKRNPMGVLAAGEGFPVAILNRNEPAFYCVPADVFEMLLDRLEDAELNAIADARSGEMMTKLELDRL